jgi:SNF2 family DNA or RNA helicase
MPAKVFAELSEKSDRINVHFRYEVEIKDAIKSIPGAAFVPRDKGGPYWRLPLDLQSARSLREKFGRDLQLGDALVEWGRLTVSNEKKLRTLAVANDVPAGELKIDKKLPELAKWMRSYQRADVAFLGTVNALNLNEPRLGKTTETIAAVYEADLEDGLQLVIAPQKSLETVWRMEIERWTGAQVFTLSGETPAPERELIWNTLEQMVLEVANPRQPLWLITTADMLRREIERLYKIGWNSFTVDEYHKTGLLRASGVNDEKKNSKFVLATRRIKAERKFGLTGTPMGGRPIKLWSGLNFIAPQVFTSKWRWAETWLEVEEDDHGHKVVGNILKGQEDQFYQAHSSYIVRRSREEVLPQLPPKQPIPVWCTMSPKQKKQYDQFALDLEIRIEDTRVKTENVLSEYTRLKQFSNAYSEVVDVQERDDGSLAYKLSPLESGKIPYLLERLAEVGIDPEDPAGQAQAIVSSQFRTYIEWVSRQLTEAGIQNILLTGKSSKHDSALAQKVFKAENANEGFRVCCMVTTMGVGLTMDNVESVHLLDETWIPDDQDQLSDRAVNTTLNHQVNVFTYRSLDTVEEYIYKVNLDRAVTNKDILDLRRQGFRATLKAAA